MGAIYAEARGRRGSGGVISTTDHDAGPPPHCCAPHGVLVPVLLDGRRWAVLLPGDPLVDHLAAIEAEGEP